MPTFEEMFGRPNTYQQLLQAQPQAVPLAPGAPMDPSMQRGIVGGIQRGLYSPGTPVGQQPNPAPPLNPFMGGRGGDGPMPFGAPTPPPAPGAAPQRGFFGSNANALMYGGLALMGGGGAQGLARGMAYGQETDTKNRLEAEKKAQQARAKEALKKAFPSMAEALDGFDDPSEALRFVQGQQANSLAERRLKAEEAKLAQPEYRVGGDGKFYKVQNGEITPTEYGGSRTKTFEQEDAERVEAMRRAGIDPDSPQGKHFRLTKELPKETQRNLTAGDKGFIRKTLTETVGLQSGIAELEKAYQLTVPTKDPKTGKEVSQLEEPGFLSWRARTAGIRDAANLGDTQTAKTVEFNRIMRSAAIQNVLSQFKGATTDTELNQALEIVGNATNSVEARQQALKRILNAMYEQRDGNLDLVDEAYKTGNQEPDALFKRLNSKRSRAFGGQPGEDILGIR